MERRRREGTEVAALALAGLALVAQGGEGAHNLAPNPSFEDLTSCPDLVNYGAIALATPWGTMSDGSPDVYNACALLPAAGVPWNWCGTQDARTGAGYAGIYVYQEAAEVREYMQAPLTRPLAPGEAVQVSFWVSLCDGCRWAVDRMGAYFSAGPVPLESGWGALAYVPQIESPPGVAFADTAGWTEVSGSFTAVGGEDHILIGGFHPDADLTRLDLGSGSRFSYVFIEDVHVSGAECLSPPNVIAGLLAVRSGPTRDDVAMSWQADLGANGYNVWTVERKQDIPDARQVTQPPAVGVVGCAAPTPAGSTTCTDAKGVSRGPALLFYQVRAFCDALSEGP